MNTLDPFLEPQIIVCDKRIEQFSITPIGHTTGSAGMDLRAMFEDGEKLLVPPRTAILVPTGLRVWIRDPRLVGLIFPRSGTGHKRGLVLGNGTGVIDSDYQGPLMVSLLNRTDYAEEITLGERIAQLVLVPVISPSYTLVTEFHDTTERGDGGFGSTGTR